MTTTKNNEHKKLNVPNLRFPEFQGEWEKCKLGDLCNVLMCKRILASQTNTEEGVPFYKIGTIGNTPDAYISQELFDEYKAKYNYPHKGEVMITCAGTVGKCVIYDGKDAYYQDSNIVWIDNPSQYITNEFLYHLLAKVDWRKLNSTTIIRIYNDDLRNLKLNYPQVEEQQKISRFLTLLDERIATQNKIIGKLQSLIKGIADKLFQTARTTKPLLEFAPNITSGTDKSGSGTIPLYGSTGIIGTVKNASQKGNIVLVARVGTIGTVQYVNEPCGVSDNALIVEAGEMTKYIYHFLKTYNFARITSGTTQPLITASSLKKAAIPTYDIESQTRIVLCLNGLEKKLDMAKQYLSEIAVMKQYLLRQMFI